MYIVILLSIAGSVLAAPQRDMRIVGGTSTNITSYPYMSNMQHGIYWGLWWYQACGGSLLTIHSVLSAAHCYSGDSASSWRVILGTSFRSTGGIKHDVSKLILHPDYNDKTMVNDVAIVKLRNPADLTGIIGVAKIAGVNYNLNVGTRVYAVGWGQLEPSGQSSNTLQHVGIDVIDQTTCANRYAYLKSQPGYQDWPDVTSDMLCAGILNVGGKDSCQGDSGGPIVHNKDVVVGVTSWGYSCANWYYPGVNTRVSSYSNWIVANA